MLHNPKDISPLTRWSRSGRDGKVIGGRGERVDFDFAEVFGVEVGEKLILRVRVGHVDER